MTAASEYSGLGKAHGKLKLNILRAKRAHCHSRSARLGPDVAGDRLLSCRLRGALSSACGFFRLDFSMRDTA